MHARLKPLVVGSIAPGVILSAWALACSSFLGGGASVARFLGAVAAFVAVPALLVQVPFLRRHSVRLAAALILIAPALAFWRAPWMPPPPGIDLFVVCRDACSQDFCVGLMPAVFTPAPLPLPAVPLRVALLSTVGISAWALLAWFLAPLALRWIGGVARWVLVGTAVAAAVATCVAAVVRGGDPWAAPAKLEVVAELGRVGPELTVGLQTRVAWGLPVFAPDHGGAVLRPRATGAPAPAPFHRPMRGSPAVRCPADGEEVPSISVREDAALRSWVFTMGGEPFSVPWPAMPPEPQICIIPVMRPSGLWWMAGAAGLAVAALLQGLRLRRGRAQAARWRNAGSTVYRQGAERDERALAMGWLRGFDVWAIAVLMVSCLPIVMALVRYFDQRG